MTAFRHKPIEVEAVQLTWSTWSEVCEFIGPFPDGMRGVYVDKIGNPRDDYPGDRSDGQLAPLGLLIPMGGGHVLAAEHDWLIREPDGRLRPCKPEVFTANYEPAEEPTS